MMVYTNIILNYTIYNFLFLKSKFQVLFKILKNKRELIKINL